MSYGFHKGRKHRHMCLCNKQAIKNTAASRFCQTFAILANRIKTSQVKRALRLPFHLRPRWLLHVVVTQFRRPLQHHKPDACLSITSSIMMQTTPAKCMQAAAPLLTCQRPHAHPFAQVARSNKNSLNGCRGVQTVSCRATSNDNFQQKLSPVALSSTAVWLLSQLPAQAEGTDFSQGSFSKESYYVTLGLFLLSIPGKFRRAVLSSACLDRQDQETVCKDTTLWVLTAVFCACRAMVTDQACTKGQTCTQNI